MTKEIVERKTAGFLEPYRVLDLTAERGLFAGAMFGRLGADVIQVEPPEGSPARNAPPLANDAPRGEDSLFWSAYAAGKRGITCALDRPEGRLLLRRLVASADVLFEDRGAGLHPDLRFDALQRVNSRLVHVTITGFGSGGPKANYADSDLIVWAAGGPLWPNRGTDGKPLRMSVPQAYLHACSDAAAGALLALFARHQTGRGQHVDVSAQQSVALTTLSATLAAAVGHDIDVLGRGSHTGRKQWLVKDGVVDLRLETGPAAGPFTNRLFAWMRREGAVPAGVAEWDWVEFPKLVAQGQLGDEQVEQAHAAVAACLARYSKREIVQIALRERLLMAPLMTTADLRESPQLEARAFFETFQENGRPRTLPWRLARTSIPSHAAPMPAPRLGQHNSEIFGSLLGIGPSELASLEEEGIV